MHSFARSIILVPTLVLALAPLPARADFYSLEGRFQCLDKPDAVCYDATPSRDPAPPPLPVTAPAVPQAPPAPAKSASAPASAPLDPILAIALRIKARRPEAGDLEALRRAAAADDARAIELLAWCSYRGLGTARDPVAAYFLYGKAAAVAVPHARENQAAIYEETLTQEQRQRVLQTEAMPQASRRVPGLLSASRIEGASIYVP
jgi:hypothetical protein